MLLQMLTAVVGHIRDIAKSQIAVRFRCRTGHTADITAMTGFDPTPTSAGSKSRSAAIFC
jgi:hypothetical protein